MTRLAVLAAIAGGLCLPVHGHGAGTETYAYGTWSALIKAGLCSQNATAEPLYIKSTSGAYGAIACALIDGVKVYRFPAGVFEINEQLLVPESTTILGNQSPNNMSDPTVSPDWSQQTLFLATRGATDFLMNYCFATDMVTTRVGFVLSSYVTVRDVSYQGIDTIRPNDNGALCGGGAFETKGCATNDCSSSVNNGGSDGLSSVHVTIDNVRLNDYYFAEDKHLVGQAIEGDYDCGSDGCCFCKPNGVRASQVGVWVPRSRNPEQGSHDITVRNLFSAATQADGINFHAMVDGALVHDVHIQNTGDDTFALWGAAYPLRNVTFKDCTAVNPGILRPNWYGNCVATYGLEAAVFDGIVCRAPTLDKPIPSPTFGIVTIDTSMFVIYDSFDAYYPANNNITIKRWAFEDLDGKSYTPAEGSMDKPLPQKMVWTKSTDGVVAPVYLPKVTQQINVYAADAGVASAPVVHL